MYIHEYFFSMCSNSYLICISVLNSLNKTYDSVMFLPSDTYKIHRPEKIKR